VTQNEDFGPLGVLNITIAASVGSGAPSAVFQPDHSRGRRLEIAHHARPGISSANATSKGLAGQAQNAYGESSPTIDHAPYIHPVKTTRSADIEFDS